jgi:hypothetical protein
MFIWHPYVRISKVPPERPERAASPVALTNDLPGMVTLPSG